MKNTYLNPNVINQIDSLYLKAKMIVEGYMSGIHKSPYHGFSVAQWCLTCTTKNIREIILSHFATNRANIGVRC